MSFLTPENYNNAVAFVMAAQDIELDADPEEVPPPAPAPDGPAQAPDA